MADSWDSVSKAAMKILGEKGKIPKISPGIAKARAADDKSFEAFDKAREELKAKLLATQNTREAVKDGISQFQDEIDESDLGLDPKSKDDAKKIAEARKILSDWLGQQIEVCEDDFKNLKELDKHLMSLMNYEQGT